MVDGDNGRSLSTQHLCVVTAGTWDKFFLRYCFVGPETSWRHRRPSSGEHDARLLGGDALKQFTQSQQSQSPTAQSFFFFSALLHGHRRPHRDTGGAAQTPQAEAARVETPKIGTAPMEAEAAPEAAPVEAAAVAVETPKAEAAPEESTPSCIRF